ncbi:MAG: RsmD family RNA methyltransferase [Thermomicrobiales bacterium]|nr:RsmD family RNA methyltransferase [Thermomicrobiales bacterium]
MRVISGTARGHRLKGPPSTATRPMADKIKGALFSMLGSLGVEIDRVLDLYAGTGSIGIEALSRGASWVDFVDQSAAATAVVRANLEHTKFATSSRVHTMPVDAFLHRTEAPYDFVILDPPYADPAIVPTLAKLAGSRLVQSGTIVAIGHSPRVDLPEVIGRMVRLRQRCHGDSCFSIYEIESEPVGEDGTGSGA